MNVCKTVYGIYYPETRRIVDELWASRPHADYEQNYTKRQDPMHRPCLARWRSWSADAGVKLGSSFGHEYPTAGANEGIHALLALHAAGSGKRIHVFEGEYEGYGHIAQALGLEVVQHSRDETRVEGADDLFFLSQPSAIDGNLWKGFDAFVASCPMPVVVDLTYVGAVDRPTPIDLDHPSVKAALWSLSKPFGVYYHRVGGLVSREEVPTLRGHHWFKNLFSLRLGEKLMTSHSATDLPKKYRPVQLDALERARKSDEVPAGAQPSDAVMLAHAPVHQGFADYVRGRNLRFCMSPGMDAIINA